MKQEGGFTLVELLTTTLILGLLVLAIAGAIVVGLRATDQTQTRLTESRNAQITAAAVVPDVQSAANVSLDDSACSGKDPVVRFLWTDLGVTKVASYVINVAPGGVRELRRVYCEAGVVVSDSIAAFDVGLVDPVITCVPICPPTGTSTPSRVTIAITAGGYSYEVSASRRTT